MSTNVFLKIKITFQITTSVRDVHMPIIMFLGNLCFLLKQTQNLKILLNLFKEMSGDTFAKTSHPFVSFGGTVANPPPPLKGHVLFEWPLIGYDLNNFPLTLYLNNHNIFTSTRFSVFLRSGVGNSFGFAGNIRGK